MANDMIVPEIR